VPAGVEEPFAPVTEHALESTPAFESEPSYPPEPSYTPQPSYAPDPAFVHDPEYHREPTLEAGADYHAPESLTLHAPGERSTPEPPMLSVARDQDRSGWRVFAFAAVAAVVVIVAVGLYLMRGSTDTASIDAKAGDAGAVTSERVSDPQPVTPSTSSSSAASSTNNTPVPPVVQEPSSPSVSAPAARGDAATPAGPASDSRGAPRAEKPPPVLPSEPVPSRPAPREPTSRNEDATATERAPAPRSSPRTPAVPAVPAEAPAATGRVLVRSTPAGARVLVDGMVRGETPVAVRDLEFGTHTIVIEAPGYPRWQQTVTLSAERPAQSFEVALDNAGAAAGAAGAPSAGVGLQIDSRPAGAQVWVDGVPAGVTPLLLPSVGVGNHSVRIELAGYQPWTTSVAVVTGERARVAASLER